MKNQLIIRLIVFIFLFSQNSNYAQEDLTGSKDHPLFTRLQNFYIYSYDKKDYDIAKFIVLGKTKNQQTFDWLEVEGRKTVIGYKNMKGTTPPSRLQITRNYVNAATKIGGKIEFDGKRNGWTGPYKSGTGIGTFLWEDVTIKFKKNDGEIWAAISFDDSFLPPDIGYFLTIIEKDEMKQEIIASSEMLNVLNTLGRIALYINFDTNKWDIKEESIPIIDEIVTMMNTDKKIKLSIEGHTDNTGTVLSNQKLSEARAKSVLDAIVKKGIDSKRLASIGFGQSKPLEDNSTEEGKAKNRRVELVKK